MIWARPENRCKKPQFDINSSKTPAKLLYLKKQYRAVKTFQLGFKNQSVYVTYGRSRRLFRDKYKTHKYSVGTT